MKSKLHETEVDMDKIICDICGTVCPENAEVCPICGCPCRDGAKAPEGVAAAAVTERGGRYSNRNVRRRHKAAQKAAAAAQNEVVREEPESIEEPAQPEENPNKPLLITIAVLVVAILLVGAYIGIRFFYARDEYKGSSLQQTTAVTTTVPPETTTVPEQTTAAQVACLAVSVDTPELRFDAMGQSLGIGYMLLPDNTTDEVTFVSSDETVAAVAADGTVTAIGAGEAAITITCGTAVETVTVRVELPQEVTETTVPPTTQAVSQELTLSSDDVSLFTAGESFTLSILRGSDYVNRSKAEWSTSDASIATVDNGKVTGVGPGIAVITAKYDGKTLTCTVRCRFEGSVTATTPESASALKISQSDVSLYSAGESFNLYITLNGESVSRSKVTWTSSDEAVATVEKGYVTAVSRGEVTITAEYEGMTVSCIVRCRFD